MQDTSVKLFMELFENDNENYIRMMGFSLRLPKLVENEGEPFFKFPIMNRARGKQTVLWVEIPAVEESIERITDLEIGDYVMVDGYIYSRDNKGMRIRAGKAIAIKKKAVFQEKEVTELFMQWRTLCQQHSVSEKIEILTKEVIDETCH